MAGIDASRRSSGRQSVLSRVQRAWGESPFYQAQLRGPAPVRLHYQPRDPSTPDKALARAFAKGRVSFGDENIDCENELERYWDVAASGGAAYRYLHGFAWLRELAALDEAGREPARVLMRAWLNRFDKWSLEAWTPELTAERLVSLCHHHQFLFIQGDAMWRSQVLTSMARQTRHLARVAHRAAPGFDRLMVAAALSLAGACIPGCDSPMERGLEMMRRELRLQIRPDGGHVSRNPSKQLRLAQRLQLICEALNARGVTTPGFLRSNTNRVAATALFFRCPDGRLAVFNGGAEDDGRIVLAVQNAFEKDAADPDFARHSGFHRLTSGRLLVLADTALKTPACRFRGGGAITIASGRSRIFVNCGNGAGQGAEWETALRKAAAHSTLSFEDGSDLSSVFDRVGHRRAEDARGHLLEIEWRREDQPDLRASRRLFMAAGGSDLRGEDRLRNFPQDLAENAVWRFHLHPGVRASLARDRKSVVLLLPNKEGWRFKSNCPELAIEKSVYCGGDGTPVATEQIVIRACLYEAADEIATRWALRRAHAA